MTHEDGGERVSDSTATEALPPETATTPPARRRRRIRLVFSLRAMMALVLVLAVGLAWQVNRARATRQAIATIRQAGGFVHFNDGTGLYEGKPRLRPPRWLVKALGQEFFFDVVSVDVYTTNTWDDRTTRSLSSLPALQSFSFRGEVSSTLIIQLATLPELREVVLFPGSSSSRDHVPGIGKLAALKKLRHLTFYAGGVEVKDLEALATLPALRELNLGTLLGEPETDILGRFDKLESLSFWGADTRLKPRHSNRLHVESWRSLKKLDICFCTLSEEEMKAIADLPNLEELSIDFGETENEHLAIFANMKSLKKLDLDSCYVTPEGIASLQSRLPSLQITGPRFVQTKPSNSMPQSNSILQWLRRQAKSK